MKANKFLLTINNYTSLNFIFQFCIVKALSSIAITTIKLHLFLSCAYLTSTFSLKSLITMSFHFIQGFLKSLYYQLFLQLSTCLVIFSPIFSTCIIEPFKYLTLFILKYISCFHKIFSKYTFYFVLFITFRIFLYSY